MTPSAPQQDDPGAIAWIDDPAPYGTWGAPDDLSLPLCDRGLQLADGLFETVLVEAGRARLMKAHLERWHDGARRLGMAPPPGAATVEKLLAEAVNRSGIGTGALRLNWSRGGGSAWRGIDLPDPGAPAPPGRFWLQLTACRPVFEPLTTIVSRQERRNACSVLSGCKTFSYGAAIQARREARASGADDALLLSTAGERLCCGTTANLLLRRDGRWLTPSLSSGCLAGVMRGRALATGISQEADLEPWAVSSSEGALLINSLGCRPITSCDGHPVPRVPEPERLWRGLLDDSVPPGPANVHVAASAQAQPP
jgi:branched-subunit amino acid aminotransferase/4-amino-4-deoxychorismate lyase